MDAEEYQNLERVERAHWYYAGKRELVRGWIQRARPPRPDDVLLDYGAGTGIFALEMAACCRVFVLDDHEEALRMLRQRFRPEQILSLSGDQVPLPDGTLDFLTALDVLEHIADDRAAIREFARLLKPGGHAVVTVPACRSLWSDWDVALHHHRRYDRAGLLGVFEPSQWEIVHVNYTNVVVFPAVWAVRKWRGWRQRHGAMASAQRPEDVVPPAWLNHLLQAIFVGLGTVHAVPFPFGVSLLLVARRRG